LNNPVALSKNEDFVTAIQFSRNQSPVSLAVEKGVQYANPNASANAGESYISLDGKKWWDLTSYYPKTNVCIKALAVPPQPGELDFPIKQGWHLLSSQVGFEISDLSIQSKNIVSIWKWDSEKSTWSVSLFDNSTSSYASAKGYQVLNAIQPGEGFWVKGETSDLLSVSGEPVIGGLSLAKGWNLVGLKHNQSKEPSHLVAGTQNYVNSLWKWKDNTWYVYLVGEVEQSSYAKAKGFEILKEIKPKEGFWVHCSQDISWQ
jgi:hypothetical protein